jgi:hypothetical protein
MQKNPLPNPLPDYRERENERAFCKPRRVV